MGELTVRFSFCEPVHAVPLGRWHIRPLTARGHKYGGGCDTISLCGLPMGWDLEPQISRFHLAKNTCNKCLSKFLELKVL